MKLLFYNFSFMGISLLQIFLLLIPTPFIDLTLGKASDFCHFHNFLLRPVDFAFEFFFEDFDLNSAFAVTFFYSIFLFVPKAIILSITQIRVFIWIWFLSFRIYALIIFFLHDHGILVKCVVNIRKGIFYLIAE